MSRAVLEIEDLRVAVTVRGQSRLLLDGVSLAIGSGEALGLVGESGSGKSVTARSAIGLFPPRAQVSGQVKINGTAVLGASDREVRKLRARTVAMIFQDPRAHINPVHTIGDFLTEALRAHLKLSPRNAADRAVEMLRDVGIPDGARRMRQHPHELSGGLLQRVMIAAALAVEPDLILADEPTTALDMTTQQEVMAILGELRRDRDLAMLFITHDLELAAATCDRTAVMYAGRIVETGQSARLEQRPLHPYTSGLLVSRPRIDEVTPSLAVIPGRPIAAFEAPAGCAFAPRCTYAEPDCRRVRPEAQPVGSAHVACLRAEALLGRLPSNLTRVGNDA